LNNVYAKSLKEVLVNADTNRESTTFFATGKTEQSYIINKFSGIKFVFVNASYEAVVIKENLNSFGEDVIIFPEVTRVLTDNFKMEDAAILNALIQIEEYRNANKNLTIIFTPNSLCGLLPIESLVKQSLINLKVGESVDLKNLTQNLVQSGYVQVDVVSGVSEFSLKGDLLTIFDNVSNKIYRISFFGDEIEEISELNASDFSRIKKQDTLKIGKLKINANINLNELQVIKNDFKLHTLKGESLEAYNNLFSKLTEYILNGEIPLFLLPLINKSVSICEYFKNYKLTIFLIEPRRFSESLNETTKNNLNTFNALLSSGIITNAHKQNFITDLFNFFKKPNFNFISFQSLLSSNNFFTTNNFLSLDVMHQTLPVGLNIGTKNQIINLVNQGFDVTIVCQNEFTKNVVESELKEHTNKINFTIGSISSSIVLQSEKIAVFGIKAVSEVKQNTKQKILPETFKEGDYVVHSFHGIGKFKGIVKRTSFGVEKDYIEIEYANSSKLFVPCENTDMLSKYSGAKPRLSVMGGKDFAKEKNKVRESVKELAFNLASLYAKRRERAGFNFVKDDEIQEEFEHRFNHIETQGQMEAINAIKKDMQSSKIMDRLVCGDVGFGKTEVALRAAFKAVLSGKQVCVLAPTTILALQHFKTFKSRMDAYQINVVLLCRFVKGKLEKQNLDDIENGKAQVIIGTHRVLSDDIKFFDLGLFIVDEEQRFGTGQKEKIKNLKKNIDSIALSATPIPRTLHLSLINVRDISVIDTPPKDRIPVQVYVCEYNFDLAISAIEAEVSRGGQVLIVYNNTEKVEEFALMLKNKLPALNVDFGHAKLSSNALEDKIFKLFNNETQVFVSTTIVENGVDLPNANTLIVIDAERFGLSQLYQIKGRVGRSTSQAYAYFFTNPNKTIGEDADKRLNALMEFSNLGSGIEIAKKDLEIRGAGNIFGAEQSGHMDRIGYAEYVKILDEEVKKASGQTLTTKVDIVVETDVEMFVDYTYAKTTEERTKIYRDLSEIESESELKKYLEVLKNKYGTVPTSVKNIGEICLIKNLANLNLNAEKLVFKKDKCQIVIDKNNFNLEQKFYERLKKCGFVLVFNNQSIINKTENSSKVYITLNEDIPNSEKLSRLKQIVG